MRTRHVVTACLRLTLPAVAADSLRTADSLRKIGDQPSGWLDTSLAMADSLGTASGLTHRWLLPLALTVLTLGGLYLLFSTRSK